MGVQEDLDFSNPLHVLVAFVFLFLTGFMFVIRLLPVAIAGGVMGTIVAVLFGGFVWIKNFGE